jgi:hypothetical protein
MNGGKHFAVISFFVDIMAEIMESFDKKVIANWEGADERMLC